MVYKKGARFVDYPSLNYGEYYIFVLHVQHKSTYLELCTIEEWREFQSHSKAYTIISYSPIFTKSQYYYNSLWRELQREYCNNKCPIVAVSKFLEELWQHYICWVK